MMRKKYDPLRNLLAFDQPLFQGWSDLTTTWTTEGAYELFAIQTKETDSEHVIRVEAAGFEKDEISIDIADLTISIRGEKKRGEDGWDTATTFSRSFTLPDNIRVEEIKAEMKDGLLFITIPKKSKVTRKITIE